MEGRVPPLLLRESEVKGLLTMRDVLAAVELAFREKGIGRVQMPPKQYLNFSKYEGDLRAMPAFIESLDVAGVKIVNSHPKNPSKYGLPTVIATIILVRPESGEPIAIIAGTWITAMRTGAASGLATKYLAAENSERFALIGGGAQSMAQLMGVSEYVDLNQVRIWSKDYALAKKFADQGRDKFRFDFKVYDNPRDCVREADIISTITPSTSPVIEDGWIGQGVHINAVGADGPGKEELDPLILKRARIFLDDWSQASHGGEVNVPLSKGLLSREGICGEISDVILDKIPGRTSPKDITIFDSTGLAIQDVATAHAVYEKARRAGVGTMIEL